MSPEKLVKLLLSPFTSELLVDDKIASRDRLKTHLCREQKNLKKSSLPSSYLEDDVWRDTSRKNLRLIETIQLHQDIIWCRRVASL